MRMNVIQGRIVIKHESGDYCDPKLSWKPWALAVVERTLAVSDNPHVATAGSLCAAYTAPGVTKLERKLIDAANRVRSASCFNESYVKRVEDIALTLMSNATR